MQASGRIKSDTDIYHIMIRGNNKQTIFHSSEDYQRFLGLMNQKTSEKCITIYAWCLMPNHVHLLVKEKSEPMAKIFISMLTGYSAWYNKKYEHIGHVFQGRYKSQAVEDQTYFLRVFRYIHRNPLEANLCDKMEDYPYSSFFQYFSSERYKDDDTILNLMSKKNLERYHFEKDSDSDFLDINNEEISYEEKIVDLIMKVGLDINISEVKSLPRDQRTMVLQKLLLAGIPYRVICSSTGISMSVVRAVSKEFHKDEKQNHK